MYVKLANIKKGKLMEVSNKDGIKIVYGILFLNAINNKNNPEQKNKIEKKLTP